MNIVEQPDPCFDIGNPVEDFILSNVKIGSWYKTTFTFFVRTIKSVDNLEMSCKIGLKNGTKFLVLSLETNQRCQGDMDDLVLHKIHVENMGIFYVKNMHRRMDTLRFLV